MFDVVFSFSHRCEKCDFICRIAIIDVVWKSIDRLKNLFFNAHDARLAETEAVRNAGKSKFATPRARSLGRRGDRSPETLRLTPRKRSPATAGKLGRQPPLQRGVRRAGTQHASGVRSPEKISAGVDRRYRFAADTAAATAKMRSPRIDEFTIIAAYGTETPDEKSNRGVRGY